MAHYRTHKKKTFSLSSKFKRVYQNSVLQYSATMFNLLARLILIKDGFFFKQIH